jgi:hypothetical protein
MHSCLSVDCNLSSSVLKMHCNAIIMPSVCLYCVLHSPVTCLPCMKSELPPQLLMTRSKHRLVNAGYSEQPCHTAWCIKLFSSLFLSSFSLILITNKQTPWSESASELYRPSDRRLSAKLVPTFVDRGCHVVSVTDPYKRVLGFLDRSRYFSIK